MESVLVYKGHKMSNPMSPQLKVTIMVCINSVQIFMLL